MRASSIHDITLHYAALHYTTLHYTTLHYTTLHYTTVHYVHTYVQECTRACVHACAREMQKQLEPCFWMLQCLEGRSSLLVSRPTFKGPNIIRTTRRPAAAGDFSAWRYSQVADKRRLFQVQHVGPSPGADAWHHAFSGRTEPTCCTSIIESRISCPQCTGFGAPSVPGLGSIVVISSYYLAYNLS